MADDAQLDILTEQIQKLAQYVTKVKIELANIKHPKARVDHFDTVSDQLNTIVETTEVATNTIMESAESILNHVDDLSANVKYPDAQNSCNSIMDDTNKIFESCSFHDLTGQRISKIVRIMDKLEGTLDTLVDLVGEEGISQLPVSNDETVEDSINMRDGDIPLHGPQSPASSASQDDIDALFGDAAPAQKPAASEPASQDDIDALFDSPAPAQKPAASGPASQEDIDAMFDAPSQPIEAEKADEKKAEAKEMPTPGKDVSQDDIDKLFG